MSLILCIDTSIENAFVCISENGVLVDSISNNIQKEHAGFLHRAIKELTERLKIELKNLSAVAVTAGPGSYTGIRVGLSTAKGICYALNKPLICINTLELLATEAHKHNKKNQLNLELFCPMIDARRMEVFTALYDENLNELEPPSAKIVDASYFSEKLNSKKMCFIGNGSDKLKKIINNQNAYFLQTDPLEMTISALAQQKFDISIFTDISHFSPIYVKEHQSFTL
jgi:tRNA threonylcarbamoyladenosine biosynthesis protein TsaB